MAVTTHDRHLKEWRDTNEIRIQTKLPVTDSGGQNARRPADRAVSVAAISWSGPAVCNPAAGHETGGGVQAA